MILKTFQNELADFQPLLFQILSQGIWSSSQPITSRHQYLNVHRVTGQLTDKPIRRQPTRTQVKSRTIQRAHTATRRQYNSRTGNLADESTSGQTY